MREALRTLKLPAAKPQDAYRVLVSKFPGPNRRPLPGQLNLDGEVFEGDAAA